MEIIHKPIMVKEILEAFSLKDDSVVADATCGEGGHSMQISALIPDGKLICIDRNADILNIAKKRLIDFKPALFFNRRFDELEIVMKEAGVRSFDAILADLGISMYHLKEAGLGFSFNDESSLDMRLDKDMQSASDFINHGTEKEIADVIYEYGEERESRKIARAIVGHRPIQSAAKLADIVSDVKREKRRRLHPATRTFQALRIYVNKELNILQRFIPMAVDALSDGGRLAIISFHSLEDRVVKWAFRALDKEGRGVIVTKKPLTPKMEEVRENPASRSAKLRIFEKRSRNEGD